MTNRLLPRANAAIVSSSGTASIGFRNFLQSLIDSGQFTDQQAEIEAILARLEALENADEFDAQVYGILSVLSIGSLQDGAVALQLVNDAQEPGNTYYYGTGQDGTKGWFTVASALAVEPRLTISVGLDGIVTFDLAELPNTGVGAAPVKTYTRDAWGRIEGDQDATTDDLPEGATNLYFTEERAQDAAGAILGDTADIDLTYDDVGPSITGLLTPAIHASLDLADSAVQSIVPGTNITVDDTDPQNPIVSAAGGGGIVETITAADSTVVIDSTDPANPTVRFTHIPSGTIVARNDLGTGIAEALTPAEVRTLLNVANGAQPGTVTSVDADGGLTGLVFSGGPVTGSGTLTLGGTLGAVNGGTGLTGYVTGNYIKAFGTTALTQVTPAQMQSDQFAGALVSINANFAVATGGAPATDMDWATEAYDVGSYFNVGLDNSAFTVPVGRAGQHVVTAQINWASNATGMRVARVFVNRGGGYVNEAGCPTIRTMAVTGGGQMTEMNIVSAPLDLAVGDKVIVRVGQDSGGNLNVVASPSSWFSIRRVG